MPVQQTTRCFKLFITSWHLAGGGFPLSILLFLFDQHLYIPVIMVGSDNPVHGNAASYQDTGFRTASMCDHDFSLTKRNCLLLVFFVSFILR